MLLPIYLYGHPVLREEAEDIDKDYPELEKLIADMWETMYDAEGVGSPRRSPNVRTRRWCSSIPISKCWKTSNR